MKKKELKTAGLKLSKNFKMMIPMLIGILLLVALAITAVPIEFYTTIFTGNVFIDSVIGAIFGSIAVGSPINSYIIGGELAVNGISLFAITAFMVSWVSVGIIQFPAESMSFGKKFAITRNVVSFILSIFVAVVVVLTMGAIS
ncbi:MAG: hypothetical protein KAS32_08195 [Candidatus Peribacteraceae bacterium]|nr:hypothetical protein [Candidatus Peribacteraceae bacterium]